jgi:hypothetical protein
MSIALKYSGSEALEMIKTYYPNDWLAKINKCKHTLNTMANRHGITPQKVYQKFIGPVSHEGETILYFAALSDMLRIQGLSKSERSAEILELESKRTLAAEQIVALENNQLISYEDKKIMRGYYVQLQQETTKKIDELIYSFPVVEPMLIIHQQGLFG